jgi:hypothetical protein
MHDAKTDDVFRIQEVAKSDDRDPGWHPCLLQQPEAYSADRQQHATGGGFE